MFQIQSTIISPKKLIIMHYKNVFSYRVNMSLYKSNIGNFNVSVIIIDHCILRGYMNTILSPVLDIE